MYPLAEKSCNVDIIERIPKLLESLSSLFGLRKNYLQPGLKYSLWVKNPDIFSNNWNGLIWDNFSYEPYIWASPFWMSWGHISLEFDRNKGVYSSFK